jgi:hypothetical protein
MQGTAKDISFPDVVYIVLHSKRPTYDTVSHLLATFPPAPRLRCHRAAKPRKGIQPTDLGQLCPEVDLNGLYAGVGCTVDGERIRLHGGQLNCSVSLA